MERAGPRSRKRLWTNYRHRPRPRRDAAPPADALKQHDQELDAIRAKQRESADSQAKLRSQITALGEDRRALNKQLIDSAARVRDVEAKIDATQARLKALDERKQIFEKSLEERRDVIVEILAALQRVGRQPPPALLVRPEDALQALRTAIMLGAVVPDMRAKADAIAGDLADLLRVRKDIVADRAALSQSRDQLAGEQLRLNMLVDERQKKQAAVEQALASEQEHAADLAHRVDNLKDLIAKLEQNLDSATRASRVSARAIEDDATRPDLAALGDPGRLAPAVAFDAHPRAAPPPGQRLADSRIRRPRRRRRHPEGALDRHPYGRADHGAL